MCAGSAAVAGKHARVLSGPGRQGLLKTAGGDLTAAASAGEDAEGAGDCGGDLIAGAQQAGQYVARWSAIRPFSHGFCHPCPHDPAPARTSARHTGQAWRPSPASSREVQSWQAARWPQGTCGRSEGAQQEPRSCASAKCTLITRAARVRAPAHNTHLPPAAAPHNALFPCSPSPALTSTMSSAASAMQMRHSRRVGRGGAVAGSGPAPGALAAHSSARPLLAGVWREDGLMRGGAERCAGARRPGNQRPPANTQNRPPQLRDDVFKAGAVARRLRPARGHQRQEAAQHAAGRKLWPWSEGEQACARGGWSARCSRQSRQESARSWVCQPSAPAHLFGVGPWQVLSRGHLWPPAAHHARGNLRD